MSRGFSGKGAAAALGLAIVARTGPAAADTFELKHDAPADVAITLTAAALIVGSELGKADLAPASCRWCARDAAGNDTLNPVDRGARDALRWSRSRLAGNIADAMGFLVVPTSSFVSLTVASNQEDVGDHAPLDMLLVGEAVMLSGVLNQAVKFVAGRERPFVHALPAAEKARTRHPSDNNLSFYSGHTSLTFSVATASGTIASLRGYRLAPVVWATCTSLAAITGYLRIAADKHYLTDVLTGALLGSAMGMLVPLLFHGRSGVDTTTTAGLSPAQTGAATLGPSPAMTSIGGAF